MRHAARTLAHQPAPLILSAYGAFGDSTGPTYHKGLQVWLDQGGAYAEAVIRGGGEYGERWHQAGVREKRANTYADFIAASEFAVRERWTTPNQLVIRGGSAGGLLVAVAMMERPELYAGVICEDPITDMIRYPLFGNGPLWADEYGVPNKEAEFRALLRYSPYHRVRSGVAYPPILVMGSSNDDRVGPVHARKFVAALQAANPSGRVLLRTESQAAHGGANTESAWEEAEADAYAFAFTATHASN